MKLNIISVAGGLLYFLYTILFSDDLLITSIGIAFTLYIFIDFIYKLGHSVPLKEFIILIASFQWIIGAKISYSLGQVHHKYYMYVEEEVYMGYVVPGVLAMSAGLFLIQSDLSLSKIKHSFETNKRNLTLIAYVLVAIGFGAGIMNKYLSIGGLAFFLYLANILLYVGVSYLFFIFPKRKWWFFFGTIGVIFILSLNSGMFHNLLLITAFFSFLMVPKNTKFITKLLVLSLGFFCIYILQIVKKDFREIIWSNNNSNPIEVFYELIEKEFTAEDVRISSNEESDEKEEDSKTNSRFNQGWIISKVLENVPENRLFLEGQTIYEAIEASILPRFLAPNKVGADQAIINFKDITGLGLSSSASMGLSIIAEFYANFGVVGGWIAMFIYGLLISAFIRFMFIHLGNNSYLIILWFILFFFQVVKAETDFIKIFNHLIKSIMFFVIIKYMLTFINVNLFPKKPND